VDGGLAFGLTVRAASVRGLAKRWAGGPRQDDLCLGLHEPSRTLVAAVADGVSGAARSQLGAALAVRHAVATVIRQLDAGEELDWRAVFQQAGWALVEAHRAATGDQGAGPDEAAEMLATTLLVAAVSATAEEASAPTVGGPRPARGRPVTIELASIGDSSALLLSDWRFTELQGGGPSGEELIGGPVQALPRAAAEFSSTQLELAAGQVLLLATDGFTMPLAGGKSEVGAMFARELRRAPGLLDFARMLDFSRSTYDDDRTLVAIWPPREP
jgi:serine/threonine protein phosphatase PrpC